MNEPHPNEIPTCADCSHLVGKRTERFAAKQWLCAHPSNVETSVKDAVSGDLVRSYKFATCYAARAPEGGCGPRGQWFQPYIPYEPRSPVSRAKFTPSADDLLGELGQ